MIYKRHKRLHIFGPPLQISSRYANALVALKFENKNFRRGYGEINSDEAIVGSGTLNDCGTIFKGGEGLDMRGSCTAERLLPELANLYNRAGLDH